MTDGPQPDLPQPSEQQEKTRPPEARITPESTPTQTPHTPESGQPPAGEAAKVANILGELTTQEPTVQPTPKEENAKPGKEASIVERYRTAHLFGELAKNLQDEGIDFTSDEIRRTFHGVDKDNLKFQMKDDGQIVTHIGFKQIGQQSAEDGCKKAAFLLNKLLGGTRGEKQLIPLPDQANVLLFDNYGLELQDALGRAEQARGALELNEYVKKGDVSAEDFANIFQRTVGDVKASGVLERLPAELKAQYTDEIEKMTEAFGEDVADTKLLLSGVGTSLIGHGMREMIMYELDRAQRGEGPLALEKNAKLRKQLEKGPWPTQLPKHMRTNAERDITFPPKKGTKPGEITISSETQTSYVANNLSKGVSEFATKMKSSPTQAALAVTGGAPTEVLEIIGAGISRVTEGITLPFRFKDKNAASVAGFREGFRGGGLIAKLVTGYPV